MMTVHRKNLIYFTIPAFQMLTHFVVINTHKPLFEMKKTDEQSLQAGQRQMELKMQRSIIFLRLVIKDTVQNLLFSARYEH